MSGLLPLDQINWDSDTCECKVEVRRYIIGRRPQKIIRDGVIPRIEPEQVWCHLHRLDGSTEEIPMRVTTIEEMVKSGLQSEYWAESRRLQLQQIEQTSRLIREIAAGKTPLDSSDPEWLARFDSEEMAITAPGPRDLEGWQGVLSQIEHGKTYADHQGYRRSPGSQTRGHLSHRCARHDNQTSTSLQSQLATYHCGCVVRQITVGERREYGINHLQWVEVCPAHKDTALVA